MRHERIETRSALPIQTRNDDNPLAEATAAVEQMRSAFEERMSGLDDFEARLSELETREQRPNTQRHDDDECEAERRALALFARNDDDTELRAMAVQSDPDGGYLVVPQLESGIRTIARDLDPIRALAAVVNVSSDMYEIIVDPSEIEGGWVGETGSRSETDSPQLKKVSIPVHEIYAAPRATQKMLDDAAFDIGMWLEGKIGDRFGRIEASAFASGDGVGKPRGFLTYDTANTDDFTRAWGQFQHIAAGATSPTDKQLADALVRLSLKLRAPYRADATWVMSRETAVRIRQIKDANDHYMWAPGLQDGQPDRLLGFPVVFVEGMPALSSGNLPIALASWPQAYQIVDRHGVRFVRDNLTAKPYTIFYSYKRVGGGAVDFNALKFLKISAS